MFRDLDPKIGFGLGMIDIKTTSEELAASEDLLIQHRPHDWRDVEALAAIETDRARAAVLDALRDPDAQVRMAVHRHAPDRLSDAQRTDSLVRALAHSALCGGLTQALLEVERFHPPEVIRALLRDLAERARVARELRAAIGADPDAVS